MNRIIYTIFKTLAALFVLFIFLNKCCGILLN